MGEAPRAAARWSFRTVVAILIAAVSVLGAIAAWRASVVSIAASDLHEEGLLQLVQKEQIRAQLEGQVDQDLRLFAQYQEHVKAWKLLERDARKVRGRDPGLAEALDAQAQGELSLARALLPFFQAAAPDLGGGTGNVAYERDFVLGALIERNADFQQLRPEETFEAAEAEHDRMVNLVLVVALFVAGLFFLTLAQFAREATRGIFAVAGVAVAALASILFIVVGGL